jgi:Leucine-rich repeat (LRR) protein
MSRSLTWLHLSDFHARKRDNWDARQITDALVRDLKTMQKDHGLRPDFIFFTGDLAFGAVSGENMTDQYQLVRNFLEAVRTAYDPEISVRDMYLVPGNHDVDRSEITPDQTTWLRHPDRQLTEIIDAMRDGKKQWRTWMERLANYRSFLTSYGLGHLEPNDPRLIWADSREIHGVRVGIAGLNSAWSCANKDEKAKLWLGADWQIAEAKNRIGPVNFSFVLIHHPGNWFTVHEDPSATRRLKHEFEIVLHGHEHQDWVEADSDGRLVLSAGACYECSWMKNGYSFGHIDLDQIQGSIYLREWDSVGRGWIHRDIAGKTKNGHWPLTNLSWLRSSDIGKTNNSLEPKIGKEQLQTSEVSAEFHYTQRYCQFVIDQHDVLELFGCDIPRELQRHQLSVAYVSLNLAREDEEQSSKGRLQSKRNQQLGNDQTELGDIEPQKNIEDSSAALEHILDKISNANGRLLINGSAGAGKSTLMRWCAIHAARQVLDNPSDQLQTFEKLQISITSTLWNFQKDDSSLRNSGDWRKKIPFLIRLRDCPNGKLPAANDLPSFLAKHLPSAPTNWMTSVFDSGQALILFDGVDEIHRDKRRQLEEEIGELIRTYPNCTYVVTTRPGAVEDGWLSRLEFTEARVEPMSRRDREEFIDKWYRSAALELKQRPRPGEDLTLTAARLKTELVEQPELGLLATNPLLCAMICALYRERQEKLPETPAELSEALCQMLLHRRERETPGLADKHFLPSWRALQYAQKKGLLAELACRMVREGSSSIERKEASSLVANTLVTIPGRAREEADDMVQALVERSGMLRPAGDDRIDFLHNTLKEYLAADCIVETGDWKILTKHADDPAWQPVILFSLSLAPEPFSSSLVKELLARVESIKKPGKRTSALKKSERSALATVKARQFFLIRCRAAAKRLAADLSAAIDAFLVDLLPPSSMNEAEALAQIGPRILNYGTSTLENGKWWATQNCYMAMRCIRLLRMVGGLKAKAALKSIYSLPSYSTQLTNEWFLAWSEISPDECLEWPFVKTKVYLTSFMITDISPLEELTMLQELYLSGTRVTSLNPLSGLTSLEKLSLCRTPIIDLAPLTNLTSLQSLDLNQTPVINLNPLSELTKLIQLDCRFTKVDDLIPLAGLNALQHLMLDGTIIEDIAPLKDLLTLRILSLRGTEVCDLSSLENLHELNILDLANTKIAELTPILGIDSLQSLNLSNTSVEDFTGLAKLSSLEFLNLSHTKIIDLTPLSNLSYLKHLSLESVLINDLTPLAGLQSLEILRIHNINVTDLRPLTEIKTLKFLYLGKTAVLEPDLECFKSLRPDVQIQKISYLRAISWHS